jgi:hypothetical protein
MDSYRVGTRAGTAPGAQATGHASNQDRSRATAASIDVGMWNRER